MPNRGTLITRAQVNVPDAALWHQIIIISVSVY